MVVGDGLGLAIFDAFGRSLSFSTDLSLIRITAYQDDPHSLFNKQADLSFRAMHLSLREVGEKGGADLKVGIQMELNIQVELRPSRQGLVVVVVLL
mgnify:CR=1 FL=1